MVTSHRACEKIVPPKEVHNNSSISVPKNNHAYSRRGYFLIDLWFWWLFFIHIKTFRRPRTLPLKVKLK